MGTKHFRSLHDFSRHRRDIELVCYCGHRAILSHIAVNRRFIERGWPTSLGSALERFRCSKCGSCPMQIGPMER